MEDIVPVHEKSSCFELRMRHEKSDGMGSKTWEGVISPVGSRGRGRCQNGGRRRMEGLRKRVYYRKFIDCTSTHENEKRSMGRRPPCR